MIAYYVVSYTMDYSQEYTVDITCLLRKINDTYLPAVCSRSHVQFYIAKLDKTSWTEVRFRQKKVTNPRIFNKKVQTIVGAKEMTNKDQTKRQMNGQKDGIEINSSTLNNHISLLHFR